MALTLSFFHAKLIIDDPKSWMLRNAAPFSDPVLDVYAVVIAADTNRSVIIAKTQAAVDVVCRSYHVVATHPIPKKRLEGLVDRKQLELEFPEVFSPGPMGLDDLVGEIDRMRDEFNEGQL